MLSHCKHHQNQICLSKQVYFLQFDEDFISELLIQTHLSLIVTIRYVDCRLNLMETILEIKLEKIVLLKTDISTESLLTLIQSKFKI